MAKQKKSFEPKLGWAIYLRTSVKESQNPENSQRRQRHAIQRTLLDDANLT